jgi:hypothetical protein
MFDYKLKYVGRAIEGIGNRPGSWDSFKVGIFEQEVTGDTVHSEKKVGEYVRHYHECVGEEVKTLYPFKQKGKWYALYSSNYTCTRVMSLPDCKDIAGEGGDSAGFCPVEYYIPTKEDLSYWDPMRIHKGKRKSEDDEYWAKLAISLKAHEREGSDFNAEEDAKRKRQWQREGEDYYLDLDNNTVGQFGFIAGCVWGDDSSWKLEYLDLSKITEGIFKREQKFGYFELPSDKTLKQCLNFEEFDGPSFTQLKALKEVTIPVMDRHWGRQEIGTIWKFNEDSIFNGLKVKVTSYDIEGSVCEILESKNEVKKKEIYLVDYLFNDAKQEKQ